MALEAPHDGADEGHRRRGRGLETWATTRHVAMLADLRRVGRIGNPYGVQ
jgi:hypothetical protein